MGGKCILRGRHLQKHYKKKRFVSPVPSIDTEGFKLQWHKKGFSWIFILVGFPKAALLIWGFSGENLWWKFPHDTDHKGLLTMIQNEVTHKILLLLLQKTGMLTLSTNASAWFSTAGKTMHNEGTYTEKCRHQDLPHPKIVKQTNQIWFRFVSGYDSFCYCKAGLSFYSPASPSND